MLGACLGCLRVKTCTKWLSKDDSFTFNPYTARMTRIYVTTLPPTDGWMQSTGTRFNGSVPLSKWVCSRESISVNTFLMQSSPPEEQHDKLCDYHPAARFQSVNLVFLFWKMCCDILRTNRTSFIKQSLFNCESHSSRVILALVARYQRTIRASVCVRLRWRPTHTLAHVAMLPCEYV